MDALRFLRTYFSLQEKQRMGKAVTRGDVLVLFLEALRSETDRFWEEMRQQHGAEQASPAFRQSQAEASESEASGAD